MDAIQLASFSKATNANKNLLLPNQSALRKFGHIIEFWLAKTEHPFRYVEMRSLRQARNATMGISTMETGVLPLAKYSLALDAVSCMHPHCAGQFVETVLLWERSSVTMGM